MTVNIVIPMAGAGSRFAKEGYKEPKPFISFVNKQNEEKMMIEHVLDSLFYQGANYILIVREEFFVDNKDQIEQIQSNYSNVKFITDLRPLEGAACTALSAKHYIDNNDVLIVADSDNIFYNGIIEQIVSDIQHKKLDGLLVTFQTNQDCFSFVEINSDGFGIKTAEKEPISTNAIAGIYAFAKGFDFVKVTEDMIARDDVVKGEFYMSNVYNYLIKQGGKVGKFDIEDNQWDCVGTPAQLKEYLKG